jgi:acetolactate synthase-1/2/3 large subunit
MVYLTHDKQSYIRAAGSLGWAFPASLGAKCAAPDRPVVCFTGDGGFWYHLSELETALRCGIKTVTVVNNNSGFGQCRPNVDRVYGDRPGNRDELCRFRRVDFSRIAQEMGCLGIQVERPEDISSALRTALQADVPVVVNVITDILCTAPPPWSPS